MTSTEKLDAIYELVTSIDRRLASGAARSAANAPAVAAAPDHELDSAHADFVVDKDPKQWKGDSFAGSHLSETTPDFCRAVAGLKKWKGDKEKAEGKTYVNKKGETVQSCEFSYKQAAWALGWAARLERGYRPAETSTAPSSADDGDSIPF